MVGATVFVGLGGREPLFVEFPQCVNVLKLMIVQSGVESYLICLEHRAKWWARPKTVKLSSSHCKIVELLHQNCKTVALVYRGKLFDLFRTSDGVWSETVKPENCHTVKPHCTPVILSSPYCKTVTGKTQL